MELKIYILKLSFRARRGICRCAGVLLILFFAFNIKAQDFHIAQYDVGSMHLNPALTGMYGDEKGDYRAYIDNRSQWGALGIRPYFTTYLAYDMPYKIKDKKIGLGAYFIHNNTGPANFNTTGFMVSGAYNILDKAAEGQHYLTAGLQLGFFYKTFNTGGLSYDAQYNPTLSGGSFDANISNNETSNNLGRFGFDSNLGIFYKYLDKSKKFHPFIGFTTMHLNRANISFIGASDLLPIKFFVHGGADIKLNDKFDLTPRFLYGNQAGSYEVNIGLLCWYKLSSNFSMSNNDWRLLLGVDYRYADAVIIHLGVKQDNYALRFSYDINASYLNNYTRGQGAWEISLVYTGEKGKSFFKTMPKF